MMCSKRAYETKRQARKAVKKNKTLGLNRCYLCKECSEVRGQNIYHTTSQTNKEAEFHRQRKEALEREDEK